MNSGYVRQIIWSDESNTKDATKILGIDVTTSAGLKQDLVLPRGGVIACLYLLGPANMTRFSSASIQ
jgi:hypothetical protein